MDHRFPLWLRTVLRRLDFLGLPNLGMLICGLGAMAYFAQVSGYSAVDKFLFDPEAIRYGGEWWRLFAFPMSDPSGTPSQPLFFLFFILFTYFIFQSIESQWGSGPLTVYVLLCYLCTAVGALMLNYRTNLWHYILLNLNLVFGTLFPNFEILLFFILPIKAKWLTLFSALLLLIQFLVGPENFKLFLLFVLFPYFLFFGSYFFQEAKIKIKTRQNRNRFDKDMWR